MTAPTDILQAAQLLAIERLVRIVRDSPSDREARMAAVALLAIKPNDAPAVAAAVPPPTPAQPDPPPLTPEELQSLRRRLPHMRPERFTRKSPSYWRSMLTEHTREPLRQAG